MNPCTLLLPFTISGMATDTHHPLKKINWIDPSTQKQQVLSVVLQNENGPCPLLAICNAFILRGELELPDNLEQVSTQHLLSLVGDIMLAGHSSKKNVTENEEKNFSDTLQVIPQLSTGLDLNVKFDSINSFELTPALLIFDFFHLELVHGWLPDPEKQRELAKILNELGSYNKAVEFVISQGLEVGANATYVPLSHLVQQETTGEQKLEGNEQHQECGNQQQKEEEKVEGTSSSFLKPSLPSTERLQQATLVAEFLSNSASQLTEYGLTKLHSINEGLVFVLFRNNHFATLYRHIEDGHLYQLITDVGYADVSEAIWERLVDVAGNNILVNSQFEPFSRDIAIQNADRPPPRKENSEEIKQLEEDLSLALKLQEEENSEAERLRMNDNQVSSSASAQAPPRPTKKLSCIIS